MNLTRREFVKGGLAAFEIPNDQLPVGKKLTIGVWPLSSLGTKGKSITAT